MARVYQTQGEHVQAIRYFEKVLEVDPHHGQAYNNLGLIHEEVGEWTAAIACFQKSAEVNMFLPEAHLNLARALYHYHGGDLGPELVQSLIERLQMVLSLDPDDEALKPIRQRVEGFLDFLASTV